MYGLLACVIFGAAFVHVMRYAQIRGLDITWVGAANYVVAVAFSSIWWASNSEPSAAWPAVPMGVLTGSLFVVAYYLFAAGLEKLGSGMTQCISRLSVAVPVVVSVVVYDAVRPTYLQFVGVGLALASVPLLTRAGSVPSVGSGTRSLLLAFGLFGVNGLTNVAMKAYVAMVPGNGMPSFLTALFGTAAVGLIVPSIRRGPPSVHDVLHGAVLGLTNVFANAGRLQGIATMSGVRFFPSEAVGTIILTVFLAALFWRERFGPRALFGMALAIAAIILVQIGPAWS